MQQQRIQRASVVWLVIIGLVLSLALIGGALPTAAQIALLALYAVIAAAVLALPLLPAVRERIPNPMEARARRTAPPTKAAQEAEARARRQSNYSGSYPVIDTGLLLHDQDRYGMSLQRARLVSLDDQAIQPYVVLHAYPERSGQTVIVRFEVLDHTGEVQFVCEDEVYLHDGSNPVLASYRMPLRDNTRLGGTGQWEMRALVDGRPVALHSFGVSPSLAERRRFFNSEGEIRRERLAEDPGDHYDEDAPISLENLLRSSADRAAYRDQQERRRRD